MNIHQLDRRSFMKGATAAAGVAAIGGAGILTPRANAAVTADTRFDFSVSCHLWRNNILMVLPSQRMQSGAWDPQNQRIFTLQQRYRLDQENNTGTLHLATLRCPGGQVQDCVESDGHMTLTDFGHGQSFGVTWDAANNCNWIWMECAAPFIPDITKDTFGTQICCFKWKPGDQGTYSTSDIGTSRLPGRVYDNLQPSLVNGVPGHQSCTVDTITNTLMLRFNWGDSQNPPRGASNFSGAQTGTQFAVYNIADLMAPDDGPNHKGNYSLPSQLRFKGPTAAIQFGNEVSSPAQGLTHMSNYVYSIQGSGWPLDYYHTHTSGANMCVAGTGGGNVSLREFDMRTGACSVLHVTGMPNLNWHEPEGVFVQRTGISQRLVFCLTSADTCDTATGARGPNDHYYANLYYMDTLVDTALSGCS